MIGAASYIHHVGDQASGRIRPHWTVLRHYTLERVVGSGSLRQEAGVSRIYKIHWLI